MKIQILSDMHQEFFDFVRKPHIDPVAELILLAGDIETEPYRYNEFLKHIRSISQAPIVAVLGNHEYFGNNIKFALNEYRAACSNIPDFHLLENDFVDFGDRVRVIGATLWTDYRDGIEVSNALRGMHDFRAIELERHTSGLELLNYIVAKHKESRSFINETLQNSNDKVNIVLTHHLPSFKLVQPQYLNSSINGAFASNLDDIIIMNSPELWICGHTHSHVDVMIGNTRVIANPLGYSKEKNSSKFIRDMIVEV